MLRALARAHSQHHTLSNRTSYEQFCPLPFESKYADRERCWCENKALGARLRLMRSASKSIRRGEQEFLLPACSESIRIRCKIVSDAFFGTRHQGLEQIL